VTKQALVSEIVEKYQYLCVPTAIGYVKTPTGEAKSKLCYHISKFLRIKHSGKFEGFKLYLKSPTHSGAPLCSWCAKVLDSLDAICTPGTSSCVSGSITLPLDTHNSSKRALLAINKGE
jgi:hypothetical protein